MFPRLTLARRLTWALAAMAIATTTLAVTVQDRALSRDLRLAAEQRLERAASAAGQLVDNHLAALQARYRTVSGTPQLRAALELADAPTLHFFAGELREREHAALVAFADAAGAAPIQSGEPDLALVAVAAEEPRLVELRGQLYAVVRVPLHTAGRAVGALVAAEPVGTETLAAWSSLCSAEVTIDPAGAAAGDALTPCARSPSLLSVTPAAASAPRSAARKRLALAGSVALAVALFACTPGAQPRHRSGDPVPWTRRQTRRARAELPRENRRRRGIDLMPDLKGSRESRRASRSCRPAAPGWRRSSPARLRPRPDH
jgi:hypothetical protein